MARFKEMLVLLGLLRCSCVFSAADDVIGMGINYGRLADNILKPSEAVSLIKKLNFKMVKIFDADAEVLQALSGSGLKVSVMVPNQNIPEIAASQGAADVWIQKNVVQYHPKTDINSVMVGNEILSDQSIKDTTWPALVPAMERIQTALEKAKLAGSIKVSTPVAADALSSSYPPSTGSFKQDIAASIIQPMLKFLSRTGSFFCTNQYPYFAWSSNPRDIPLNYALFESSQAVVRDGDLGYTNLLDAMVDATIAAMEKLGYGSLDLTICETGWPTKGDASQPGASPANAATYNNKLVQKTLAAQGTPKRPGSSIPTHIFALFNENFKPGPTTERNWGVTYPDGVSVYGLEALARGSGSTPSSRQWCVANPDASVASLQAGLDYGCSNGADCSAIQTLDQPCFFPDTVPAHASYAFSSYWSSMNSVGGTCDFGGAGLVSNTDPSYGDCKFPART